MAVRIPLFAAVALLLLSPAASLGQVVGCGSFSALPNYDFPSSLLGLEGWETEAGVSWSDADSDGAGNSGSMQIEVPEIGTRAATVCVAVDGGGAHDFSTDVRLEVQGQVEGKAGMIVRWYSDTECTDELPGFPTSIYTSIPSDWAPLSGSDDSPLNAVSALVELRATKTAGSGGSTLTASFDEATFFVIGDPDCGDPICPHERIGSSDALWVLRASVGASPCLACICDVNGTGDVAASDALAVLRMSVGIPETLACPVCN